MTLFPRFGAVLVCPDKEDSYLDWAHTTSFFLLPPLGALKDSPLLHSPQSLVHPVARLHPRL